MNSILTAMAEKMEHNIEAFQRDLSKIRTGRATLSVLDGVKIDAYGAMLPLNQVASLTIPESRMIVIQPWDMQQVHAIERAIHKADLGLNPVSDGKVIRVSIPQLTEERRRDLVKQMKKTGEEYRVHVRNQRRDTIEILKKRKKDKEISEDDLFRMQEEAQKHTDKFIARIDAMVVEKEKEVMEV